MLKLLIREPKKEATTLSLDMKAYTLGRSKGNDIVISDETISRQHARIQFESGGYVIEDLNSSLGVYVNGAKTPKKKLADGDVILIGETEIRVSLPAAEDDKTRKFTLTGEEKTKILKTEDVKLLLQKGDAGPQAPPAAVPAGQAAEGTRKLEADEINRLGIPRESSQFKTVAINPKDLQQVKVVSFHKLLAVAGDRVEKEYVLDRPESIIGRLQECQIKADDDMVSGKHAALMVRNEKCFIKDLNSKNGTMVNGKPITGERQLANGDVIEVGPKKFTFVQKGSVVSRQDLFSKGKPGTKNRPKNKLLVPACVVFCIFIVVLLSLKFFQQEPEKKAPSLPSPAQSGAEPLQPLAAKPQEEKVAAPSSAQLVAERSAEIYYSTAKEFLENRLWEEAADKFKEVIKLKPDYPQVQEGIQKVEYERGNRGIMENGLSFINQHKYPEGIKELERIPDTSVYYNEALIEIQAAKRDVEQEKEKIAAAAAQQKKASQAPAAPREKEKPSPAAGTGQQLIEQALKYYVQGNIQLACKKLDAAADSSEELKAKASSLKEKLQNVQSTYDKGLSAYNSGQASEAFKTWADVLGIDQEIVGQQSSHYATKIGIYMAEKFYADAREAFDGGKYTLAQEYCMKASRAKPGHTGCAEIEKGLLQKAKKLYEEGYVLEDLNPAQAVQKWKEVMSICPPDNEYYKKAQKQVAKYKNKGK